MDWYKIVCGPSIDEIVALEVDPEGNVYALGSFMGTVDFDPGEGVFELTSPQSFGVFVQKLSKDGTFLWAHQLEGVEWGRGMGMALDHDGNVIITGSYFGFPDFQPENHLNQVGKSSGFIEKLDSSGELLWSIGISTSGSAFGKSVAIGTTNDIYIAGGFSGETNFDPSNKTPVSNSVGGNDAFLLNLSASGEFQWVKTFGSKNEDNPFGMTAGLDGSIFIVGSCGDGFDADPSRARSALRVSGNVDAYVQKLDSNGALVWAKTFGGTAYDVANAIAVDHDGNIVICGTYEGSGKFDKSNPAYSEFNSGETALNGFVLKLNEVGDVIWNSSLISDASDQYNTVAIDSVNNIFVAGYICSKANYSNSSNPNKSPYHVNTYETISNLSNAKSGFIQRLTPDGDVEWHYLNAFEKFYADSIGEDVIRDLIIDGNGDLLFSGSFNGEMILVGGYDDYDRVIDDLVSKYYDGFIKKTVSYGNWVYLCPMPLDDYTVVAADDEYFGKKLSPPLPYISFGFYPNPASEFININCSVSLEEVVLDVFDKEGRLVRSDAIDFSDPSTLVKIDISNLENGMYNLRFIYEGEVVVERLVVHH